MQINSAWELGLVVCLLWTGMDVFLSTTSILHLCAIALNRYLAIAYPLRFRNNQSNCHIVALLIPAWVISFALSLPLVVHGALNNEDVLINDADSRLQCGIFYREFAIFSSVVSFFLPLTIMVVADIRSVQILRNTSLNNVTESSSAQNGHRMRLTGVPNSNDSDNDSPFDTPSTSMSQLAHFTTGGSGRRVECCNRVEDRYKSQGSTPTSPPREQSIREIFRTLSFNRTYVYSNFKFNSRERRAEKTLIWVFVCFVVLWLPFFCTNITYGICKSCDIPTDLFHAFTWLGYISSGVNPCIYTFLNKDFRNAFKRILCCSKPKRYNKGVSVTLYS